eukprot:GDKJ01036165.1.p1 GENE.GDKJ01036165.1~~GDKJ01036165.1.p1  ORF type:complete len:477 (+),score=114.72 GDKJ01036165.1:196-1431(+)
MKKHHSVSDPATSDLPLNFSSQSATQNIAEHISQLKAFSNSVFPQNKSPEQTPQRANLKHRQPASPQSHQATPGRRSVKSMFPASPGGMKTLSFSNQVPANQMLLPYSLSSRNNSQTLANAFSAQAKSSRSVNPVLRDFSINTAPLSPRQGLPDSSIVTAGPNLFPAGAASNSHIETSAGENLKCSHKPFEPNSISSSSSVRNETEDSSSMISETILADHNMSRRVNDFLVSKLGLQNSDYDSDGDPNLLIEMMNNQSSPTPSDVFAEAHSQIIKTRQATSLNYAIAHPPQPRGDRNLHPRSANHSDEEIIQNTNNINSSTIPLQMLNTLQANSAFNQYYYQNYFHSNPNNPLLSDERNNKSEFPNRSQISSSQTPQTTQNATLNVLGVTLPNGWVLPSQLPFSLRDGMKK